MHGGTCLWISLDVRIPLPRGCRVFCSFASPERAAVALPHRLRTHSRRPAPHPPLRAARGPRASLRSPTRSPSANFASPPPGRPPPHPRRRYPERRESDTPPSHRTSLPSDWEEITRDDLPISLDDPSNDLLGADRTLLRSQSLSSAAAEVLTASQPSPARLPATPNSHRPSVLVVPALAHLRTFHSVHHPPIEEEDPADLSDHSSGSEDRPSTDHSHSDKPASPSGPTSSVLTAPRASSTRFQRFIRRLLCRGPPPDELFSPLTYPPPSLLESEKRPRSPSEERLFNGSAPSHDFEHEYHDAQRPLPVPPPQQHRREHSRHTILSHPTPNAHPLLFEPVGAPDRAYRRVNLHDSFVQPSPSTHEPPAPNFGLFRSPPPGVPATYSAYSRTTTAVTRTPHTGFILPRSVTSSRDSRSPPSGTSSARARRQRGPRPPPPAQFQALAVPPAYTLWQNPISAQSEAVSLPRPHPSARPPPSTRRLSPRSRSENSHPSISHPSISRSSQSRTTHPAPPHPHRNAPPPRGILSPARTNVHPESVPRPHHTTHPDSRPLPTAPKMPINIYGKHEDTVDFGEDMDYSGFEWFKDTPTPRQAHTPPSAPQTAPPTVSEAYMPLPGVIEQNEMFDYALKSAPNVLLARFKQYGQLGVLAWCSEFAEMIDALKALGFEGNMFVATRAQALQTCEDILKLKLDVRMQIIVMYLSSQVARLRRFLDGGREWDDYPEPQFPLDYRQY